MQAPSSEYENAPAVSKSREVRSSGVHRLVLENFATAERPTGVTTLRLSHDEGRTFTLLVWHLAWWDRMRLLMQGRSWPPDHAHVREFDDTGIELSYIDHLDASQAEVFTVRYDFAAKRWRLGRRL